MPGVWLKLIAILCLSCTALSASESSEVLWRDVGGTVTIQCRPPEPEQDSLTLKKGLSEDFHVLFKERSSENIINKPFTGRIQLNGAFPNVDILIKNLTLNDTGTYWCFYAKFDQKSTTVISQKGKGSVLLVVTSERAMTAGTGTQKECGPSDKYLVVVAVVISAAVLLGIIMGFLIWIILKTKTLRSTVKPRRAATNDVYEDMRGTLRR